MTPRILKIGDKIWFAFTGTERITEVCPVCFGKLSVTLILGNGEEVATPCDYCGKGFDGPLGVVNEWKYAAEARLITVTDVEIRADACGEVREYSHKSPDAFYRLDWLRVFDTEAEAAVCAATLAEEAAMTEIKRRKSMKEHNQKSYSWHVGYHRNEAKRAKRDFEYHTARALVCKRLAKTPVPTP
jgi:hypothetical protein